MTEFNESKRHVFVDYATKSWIKKKLHLLIKAIITKPCRPMKKPLNSTLITLLPGPTKAEYFMI